MAYIGKSPTGTGVRSRYYYTATGGETSLSGADDNSNTLVFSDGNYVDVSLNGVSLVAGTDYNTSTANTIGGLAALSASDVVEIVVYDIFTVADTVSAKNGGTFSGNVAIGGTLSVTGASTLTGDLTVDTNTLYVDSTNNRVGVGDASPPTELVLGSGTFTIKNASTDSNGLKIYQAGSDTSTVMNHYGGAMVFGTNNTERMRIDSSGSVLVAKSTSSFSTAGLEIRTVGAIDLTRSAGSPLHLNRTSSVGEIANFYYDGTPVGSITVAASSTAYNTSSDYRLKTNVTYDWDATTRLKQLRPARFEWIVDGDDAVPVDGFLAHELATVIPESVTGTHNEVDDEGNPVYQGVDQSKLTPLLTKALIEAVEKIEQLEARITALEAN